MGVGTRHKYTGRIYIYALRNVGQTTIRYVGLTENPAVRLTFHAKSFGDDIEMLILEHYDCIDRTQLAERAWIAYFEGIAPGMWNGVLTKGGYCPDGIAAAINGDAEVITIEMAKAVAEYQKITGYRRAFSHVDGFTIDGNRYHFKPTQGTKFLIQSWDIVWFRLPEFVKWHCEVLFDRFGIYGSFAERMDKLQSYSGLSDSDIFVAAIWFVEFTRNGLPSSGKAMEVSKLRKVFGKSVSDFYRDWNDIGSAGLSIEAAIWWSQGAAQAAQKGE